MYRLILLLVAIQAIAVQSWHQHHHSSRCSHRHPDYKNGSHKNDEDFHELSWAFVRADRKAQRICDEHVSHTTETFYTTHYEMSVPLPDYSEDQISVKLQHRVLLIQAIKDTDKIFSELKIIPEFAKGNAASWRFDNNVLKIYVPYEITFNTEVIKVCNNTIDESLVTIPMANTDFRFGNDETTVASLDDDNIF